MRSLRVAVLAWRDLVHPRAGGSEFVVDRICDGLRERGHDVVLLAGAPVTEHAYRVVPTGGTYAQYLRAPLVYHHKVRRADVVLDVQNGIPFFAPLWQRAPSVCLVHHVHTEQWAMEFGPPVAAIGRWLERRAMPWAYRHQRYVAVSDSTARALGGLGIPSTAVTTIEMGAAPVVATGERSVTPRFLVLGRLVAHKRVEKALTCWPRVRAATGGTLVIAGDGPELERLRPLATEGVEFAGFVTEERKAAELGAAWVLVHPAHHEGWGTVVIEAAAAGVPTVAYDVEGVRDSVVADRTGILAVTDDEFAEAWIRLGTDATRCARMGRDARERAAGLTWPNALDALEDVLEGAVHEAGRW
ncbi:MAG: glycosyltransferase family 4 protein [Actinomycetes bacterium]